MRSALHSVALSAFFAALGAATGGTAVHANTVFDFRGTCNTGCSGTATGVATFTDAYAFGSTITPATFVSFSYASSDFSSTIPVTATDLSLGGGLNADGSLVSNSTLVFETDSFTFEALPGEFAAIFGRGPGYSDEGSSFQFTLAASSPAPSPVPEPGTAELLAAAVAGGAAALRLWRRLPSGRRRSEDASVSRRGGSRLVRCHCVAP